MMVDTLVTEINAFSNFQYWFYKVGTCFKVFNIATGEHIGHAGMAEGPAGTGAPWCTLLREQPDRVSGDIQAEKELVCSNFRLFTTRPEYLATEFQLNKQYSMEDLRVLYSQVIIGICLIRARKGKPADVDNFIEKIDRPITWLEQSGFFTGPSSTQYHDAVPGGNVYHHLRCMSHARDMCQLPQFSAVKVEDAIFVSAVHDWCKIDAYEAYTKKLPNEAGNWVPTTCYKYKDNLVPLGHGVSSLYLAMKFFRLSEEEALAIRWHMGSYRCVDSEQFEMYQACEKYPLVFLLQFADQLATASFC